MKPKILKLCSVVLLLFILLLGCESDDEGYPNPEPYFEFVLLNEGMEQDSIFSEGDNFYFYFSIDSKDEEWAFNRLVKDDPNFFKVYKIKGNKLIDFGSPFKSKWCETIYYECGKGNPLVFKLPWITGIGENEIPDQNIFPPFCMFYETRGLPKGQYITFFDERIEFVRCGELIDPNWEQYYYLTNEIHFEIKFEIK